MRAFRNKINSSRRTLGSDETSSSGASEKQAEKVRRPPSRAGQSDKYQKSMSAKVTLQNPYLFDTTRRKFSFAKMRRSKGVVHPSVAETTRTRSYQPSKQTSPMFAQWAFLDQSDRPQLEHCGSSASGLRDTLSCSDGSVQTASHSSHSTQPVRRWSVMQTRIRHRPSPQTGQDST